MYAKLFARILDSSIWLEPTPTRIVWITLLAAMNEDGFAHFASVKNLANRAALSIEETKAAVATLEAPDPDSTDPEHEGRRIERVPGGWMILNGPKYRAIADRERQRAETRERVAAHRARKKQSAPSTQKQTQKHMHIQGETKCNVTSALHTPAADFPEAADDLPEPEPATKVRPFSNINHAAEAAANQRF